jgi:AcrR family transcriptional regulator
MPKPRSTDAPISTTREDWIAAALEILITQGAGEVKVLTLAQRMGCSRSNFYWFFKDREALLEALLDHWQARNTQAIVERAARPVHRISQGVLHIFDCWADPALFDARLDFAIREWARRSDAVRQRVNAADHARLAAITRLFARFEPDPAAATVRARTLYFMQIGYYALGVEETVAQRMALLKDYVAAFCGEVPDAADLAAFIRRNTAKAQTTATVG